MTIYQIPGLGFDHRIFQRLELGKVEQMDWVDPLKGEDLAAYAARLAEGINESDNNVIIGHSLGGIVAQEIALIKPIRQIILISSIRSRLELPRQFRIVRPMGLHRLFTKGATLKTVKFWGKGHDYVTAEEQALFKSMVGKHSNLYLQWALRELSGWKGIQLPEGTSICQIHGAKDKTFPIGRIVQADHVISEAGHFMVYKHPEILNPILKRELSS